MSQVNTGVEMDGVKLKLNPEKDEFIIIGQKAIRESLAPNFPVPLSQWK